MRLTRITRLAFLAAAIAAAATPMAASAQTRIGEIDTNWRIVGPDDKIVVERYDDPAVRNVSCYVSRAQTGGVRGYVGLAVDPSRFSISCRGIGKVMVPGGLPASASVFSASASPLFKTITVTRMIDAEDKVLVYVATSTKLLAGSSFSSISAVPAGD